MNARRGITYAVIAALAAAGVGSTAHAQEGDDPIPAWIQTVFIYYANGEITGAELIGALEYLIAHDIIQITTDAGAERAAERERVGGGERAAAEAAAERATAAIGRAAELADAAADSLTESTRADNARDKGTSPSAIRQNNARADAAAREAAEAAEAAAEAIAEAAEAAEAAAEAAREADMDTTVTDSQAHITATINTAAGSLIRTSELAAEAKKHAEYISVFRANSPSADLKVIRAISEATDTAAEGARTAHLLAARATYSAAIASTGTWHAEAVAEAAEAAEQASAAGASEHAADEAASAARTAERARCEAEKTAEADERAAAEAEAAAGHFVFATTELSALAKDVIDGDANVSTITSIWTSINIGADILNSVHAADQARGISKCI